MLELRSPRGHGSLPSDGSEPNGGNNMAGEVNRRDFLSTLGVSVGAALTASAGSVIPAVGVAHAQEKPKGNIPDTPYKIGHMTLDRKSTRLNSSHLVISYAVFCLKKKKK